METTPTYITQPFASFIMLWVRKDQPRQKGMDYWKGPHSKIISATPGFDKYRQIHLAEHNPGLWPPLEGVETAIAPDRQIDGVAEVTFRSVFSPLLGRKQTQMAYQDEVNVFRRTLLYAGLPYSARWYQVGSGKVGSRALICLRRKEGVSTSDFRRFLYDEFVAAVASTSDLKELRTQVFMPWVQQLWATPKVAHDNPRDQHFHASMILGFADADADALPAFFASEALAKISGRLPQFVSAVHAYEMQDARTFVRDGTALPTFEK